MHQLLADNKDLESTIFDDKKKVDIRQKQFSSDFTREPDDDIPTMEARTKVKIKALKVTLEAVKKLIKKLNINRSVGPDEILTHLLIELCDIISAPLTLLMNKTLEGHVPDDWINAFMSSSKKEGEIVQKTIVQ